jgi:hypothetical protein
MIIVLQAVGVVAALVGLLTIGVGIPVKEFSFGNTLIVAGTVGLCTGLILLGLSVVALELRMLARRLAGGVRPAAEPRAKPALPPFPAAGPASVAPGEGGPLFSRDQPPPMAPQAEPGAAPPVPWQEESGSRARPEAPSEVEPAQAAPAQKPRRNLMFQSSLRKERERPPSPPPRAGDDAAGDFRAQPQAAPPAPETAEAPPANFEDAWPKPDRPRGAEVPPQRRSSRLQPAAAESNAPAAAERTAPARAEEPQAVTVLKSGVVDGMAYSLYSDGSIEAQMPEGMMRFTSIDELRAHLDQRP